MVKVGGGSARVRMLGSGEPPLVVLPDPPNVVEHYDMLLPRLARERRVICCELPGFGFFRPPPDHTFSMEDTAALLAKALCGLGVQRATVTCACIGAHAVLYMAERWPELVERVFLLQFQAFPAAQAWVQTVNVHGIITLPWIGQVFMDAARYVVVRHWYDASLPPGVCGASYAATAVGALRSGASFPLASAFQSFRCSGGRPLTRKLDSTIVWGGDDPCHVDSDPRAAIEAIPQARFILLPGVGHFPDLERPDLFVELVGRERA